MRAGVRRAPDRDTGRRGRARWLTRFVRASRVREPVEFVDANLDRGTLDEIAEITGALAAISPEAAAALQLVQELRGACDGGGNLPEARREELAWLLARIEARLE